MKCKRWKNSLPLAGIFLALVVLSVAPRSQAAAAKSGYNYNFEQDLGPWTAGWGSGLGLNHADSFCPVDDGHGMALIATPELGRALFAPLAAGAPQRSVAYMGAAFPVTPYDIIKVDWATKPEQGCDPKADCTPMIAVSQSDDPDSLVWHAVKDTTAVDGWTIHNYAAGVTGGRSAKDQVYVALGVARSGPNYGFMALGVDCVQIRIAPGVQ